MLQAKTKNGLLITLAVLAKAEIDKMKTEKQNFFCPTCNNRVIIKAGSKMIPHFAHQSLSDCPASEGGEGDYHERGKLLLYKWLQSQKIDVELEKYLSENEQRPDLLITLNQKRIAIEYQCARIPTDQIHERNHGYVQAGITPIWILGANRIKRQSSTHMKIDQLTLQFIHQFSSDYPQTLYYFCPNTLQFIKLQDIYLTRKSQAITTMNVKRLNELTFTDLFKQQPFLPHELYQLWKKEKQKFRLKQKKNLYGNELAWYQWLHMNGTYVDYLPSIVHLPVASQYLMQTHTWNWQSRIVIHILHPLQTGNTFTINACESLLKSHLLQPSFFPLIHSKNNPIREYLQLLVQLDVLKEKTPSTYEKIHPISFHNHIETALTGDNALMDRLIQKGKSKIQA